MIMAEHQIDVSDRKCCASAQATMERATATPNRAPAAAAESGRNAQIARMLAQRADDEPVAAQHDHSLQRAPDDDVQTARRRAGRYRGWSADRYAEPHPGRAAEARRSTRDAVVDGIRVRTSFADARPPEQ